jgi:triosephosphate isomerase
MRKPLIAGNWKMYKDHREATALVSELWPLVKDNASVDFAVCPPFTSIPAVAALIEEQGMTIGLGAQDVYYEAEGAFTGEVSTGMLKAVGVDRVIIGHSERRQIIGEDDNLIARKLHAVLADGMQAILCCGETLEEREAGNAFAKVEGQMRSAFDVVDPGWTSRLVIAYEPIWAIGTGLNATPDDAQEIIAFLRKIVEEVFTADVAAIMRILYGGSVKPGNTAELMTMPDVDGALVGGASLKAADFAGIINYSEV